MQCEKCGKLLDPLNGSLWLIDGIVLCINCESELKALKQVVGYMRHCYDIIGRAYRKKLEKIFDGIYNHFEERGFGAINQ